MNTFLSIMQSVAKNAGIEVPTTTSANDPDHVKLAQFINEAGQELSRRVDWGPLRKTATLNGSGSPSAYAMPADFDRLPLGLSVMVDMNAIRGSLTPDEWFSLSPSMGSPRYFYLSGARLSFYPYPPDDASIRVQYQSRNWVNGDKSSLDLDSDTPVISANLISMGAVWRWRRHVGKDYSDQVAEFEAALVDRARSDSAVRLP